MDRFLKVINRSPTELFWHLNLELKSTIDRFRNSPVKTRIDRPLNQIFGFSGMAELWYEIGKKPYPLVSFIGDTSSFLRNLPEEENRVKEAAGEVMLGSFSFLGCPEISVSNIENIDWGIDFKNNYRWPAHFFRDLDLNCLDATADIKIPWELSRMQWLVPIAQSFLLDPNEKYAEFCRDIIWHWINANPYARGPNWGVAMEAAMRIFMWTWLFKVFHTSKSWSDPIFQSVFLTSLFEHGIFCNRYLENFGVNSNHILADGAALVFLGEFFPQGKTVDGWGRRGWKILEREVDLQVYDDGASFEASTSYHRLSSELLLWPAQYRLVSGKPLPQNYRNKLLCMAEFASNYINQNGLAPNWGDNDDARVFKLGNQGVNDHSYLSSLIKCILGDTPDCLIQEKSKPEILWALGSEWLDQVDSVQKVVRGSARFENAGIYILRGNLDHVFIDCGPIGFGGRGGHGHNDCLSFEAFLDGTSLITDSGSYTYTEDFELRNKFRGTAYHNTPMVNNCEQNLILRPKDLFRLKDQTQPIYASMKNNHFQGSHSGYKHLGVSVERQIKLTDGKMLEVSDRTIGSKPHRVEVPFHFVPNAVLNESSPGLWEISVEKKKFQLINLSGSPSRLEKGWFSESYGVMVPRPTLIFSRDSQFTEQIDRHTFELDIVILMGNQTKAGYESSEKKLSNLMDKKIFGE